MKLDSIHASIRRFRMSKGLSMESMANEIGVSRTSYFNLESGRTPVFCKLLRMMAEHYGCSPETIIFRGASADLVLHDDRSRKEELEALRDTYEKRLEELHGRIRDMEEKLKHANALLCSQRQTIKSLRMGLKLMKKVHKND